MEVNLSDSDLQWLQEKLKDSDYSTVEELLASIVEDYCYKLMNEE